MANPRKASRARPDPSIHSVSARAEVVEKFRSVVAEKWSTCRSRSPQYCSSLGQLRMRAADFRGAVPLRGRGGERGRAELSGGLIDLIQLVGHHLGVLCALGSDAENDFGDVIGHGSGFLVQDSPFTVDDVELMVDGSWLMDHGHALTEEVLSIRSAWTARAVLPSMAL